MRWYRNELTPLPGETWKFKLRLRPPRGLANFQGNDSERAYFASGIGALATVLDARRVESTVSTLNSINSTRAWVRGRIQEVLPESTARALFLSLAIADRSELRSSDWAVLRATGTGHLLAISGLHIGLAAVLGFWLCRCILLILPGSVSRGYAGFTFCCMGALVLSAGYGALAGFPVSTLRAIGMLTVATLVLRFRATTNAIQAWWLALLLILALNPFSFLTAGFWLSFGAVLALILFFSPRCDPGRKLTSLPRAQIAVMALTLPLGAFWFQSGSWLSMPANLFSIPWVSLVTVPLILASIVSIPLSGIFPALAKIAVTSCDFLWTGLNFLAGLGDLVLTPYIGPGAVALGVFGGVLILLPGGLTAKWMGLGLLVTLVLPRSGKLEHGEYSLEVMDVGQGLAVEVRTANHALLYDTGPGDGKGWSTVGSVIAPALASEGMGGPDLIAVSHADLDHAGGLGDAILFFPDSEILFNGPDHGPGHACKQGTAWTWDGVTFKVLHPSGWLPYLGNDSSCVISIDNGQHRSLLTGDIGKAVESRLLGLIDEHQFITVPHHGSTSSSGRSFLQTVNPTLAVVSAAYGNRFGFPKEEVLDAYNSVSASVLSTIDCGAVRVHFPDSGEPRVEVARLAGGKPWRLRPEMDDCVVRPRPAMYHLKRPKNKE